MPKIKRGMLITPKMLQAKAPDCSETKRFAKEYPRGLTLTPRHLHRVAREGYSLGGFANAFLSPTLYDAVCELAADRLRRRKCEDPKCTCWAKAIWRVLSEAERKSPKKENDHA